MPDNQVDVKNVILQEDLYHNGKKVLSYKIQYPQFSSPVFQVAVNRMNQVYRMEALAFQRYCRNELLKLAIKEYEYSVSKNFPIRPYEAVLIYEVTYNKNCTLSLYFDRYEYTGGAHGLTKRYSDTWNLTNAKVIELKELFNPEVPEKEYIFKNIDGIIAEQIDSDENLYFDNYEENIQDKFNINSFYLTDAGVVFYFQQYDIGPYSSGIIEFTIPFSAKVLNEPKC